MLPRFLRQNAKTSLRHTGDPTNVPSSTLSGVCHLTFLFRFSLTMSQLIQLFLAAQNFLNVVQSRSGPITFHHNPSELFVLCRPISVSPTLVPDIWKNPESVPINNSKSNHQACSHPQTTARIRYGCWSSMLVPVRRSLFLRSGRCLHATNLRRGNLLQSTNRSPRVHYTSFTSLSRRGPSI